MTSARSCSGLVPFVFGLCPNYGPTPKVEKDHPMTQQIIYGDPVKKASPKGGELRNFYSRITTITELDNGTTRRRRSWLNLKTTDLVEAGSMVKRLRDLQVLSPGERLEQEEREERAKRALATFREACESWLAVKEGEGKSARYCESLRLYAESFWLPRFGDVLLRKLTTADFRKYFALRRSGKICRRPGKHARRANKAHGKELSASTINTEASYLRTLFRWVIDEDAYSGVLERNPVAAIKQVKGDFTREKTFYMTDEQRTALIAAAGEPFAQVIEYANRSSSRKLLEPPRFLRPLIRVALYSGLRRRTLIGLKWKHILEVGAPTHRCEWALPGSLLKNGNPFERPVWPEALQALDEWRDELRDHVDALTLLHPDAPVFAEATPSSIKENYSSAVKRAALALDDETFSPMFHDCRRAFIGLCRRGSPQARLTLDVRGPGLHGFDLETTASWAGATIEVVSAYYRRQSNDEMVAHVSNNAEAS